MKKIIITIVLFLALAVPASAFYYNNQLVSVWNSRPDLQKAFPGDPSNNAKLETWAKKYGWKETPELFNYYPDKAIVEKIIDNKTNDRMASLEKQITELTAKVNLLQNSQGGQTTIIQQTRTEGTWRDCKIDDKGVHCGMTIEEKRKYNSDRFNLLFFTKYE